MPVDPAAALNPHGAGHRDLARLLVARDAAVRALTAPDLVAIVDLVAYPESHGEHRSVVVANATGMVRLHPDGRHELLGGRDPVGRTDPMAFLPYEAEIADPAPGNERNAYPDPARRLLSFFGDPERSPDLTVVHSAAHYFPDEGGHLGEHGSLDVVQSRAPLLVAGAGVARRGVVADHARVVDVAPTLLLAAGLAGEHHHDATGAPLDGVARSDLIVDPQAARFVVGILWDGAPGSELLHLARAGELPGVARLLERGTALAGGAIAEFPSVTLCNHTSLLTGVGPGRHGVLGNVFFDRETGRREIPNDMSTWHHSARWLRPGVATVFERLAAVRPGIVTACVNEAVDRGATWSTMQQLRLRELASATTALADLDSLLPAAQDSPFVGDPALLEDPSYRWWTRVDDLGLAQLLNLFASVGPAPRFAWWSQVITDAGHHAGGPRSGIARASLRDADRRLQAFLAHLDRLGITDDVTFLLTADHGFEGADPQVTGSWTPALHAALDPLGVTWRDEGPGLVYLGVPTG